MAMGVGGRTTGEPGLPIPSKEGRGLGSVVPGQGLEGCILAGFAWRLVVRRYVNRVSALSHSFT